MMTSPQATFLASLVRRYPSLPMVEAAALPQKYQDILKQSLPQDAPEVEQLLVGYQRMEGLLHPSWQHELFLALPESVQSSPLLQLGPTLSEVQRFLCNYAVEHSSFAQVQDVSVYKNSKVAWLLSMPCERIVTVVELLSIFAIIEPFLRILDKARLQKLSFVLTAAQKKFLSHLLLVPRPTSFEPLDLHAILVKNKSEVSKSILFDKGVELLTQALVGEKEALIWHLCYKVEMGLGKRIHELWQRGGTPSPDLFVALEIIRTFMKVRK